MKAKGILIIAVACFVLVGLAVLKEGARSDEPQFPAPALYGVTYVEGVATNGVYVRFSIEHGGYDYCTSYNNQGDGNYLIGESSDWGDWCVWATYTDSTGTYLACADGYRQQGNSHADQVNVYLEYYSGPGTPSCGCWPQEGGD
jgi:hypothetical protein